MIIWLDESEHYEHLLNKFTLWLQKKTFQIKHGVYDRVRPGIWCQKVKDRIFWKRIVQMIFILKWRMLFERTSTFHSRTYPQTRTHTHIYTYTYRNSHTRQKTFTYTHKTQSYARTHTHTHTQAHTYTYTNMLTRTHTCTHGLHMKLLKNYFQRSLHCYENK